GTPAASGPLSAARMSSAPYPCMLTVPPGLSPAVPRFGTSGELSSFCDRHGGGDPGVVGQGQVPAADAACGGGFLHRAAQFHSRGSAGGAMHRGVLPPQPARGAESFGDGFLGGEACCQGGV